MSSMGKQKPGSEDEVEDLRYRVFELEQTEAVLRKRNDRLIRGMKTRVKKRVIALENYAEELKAKDAIIDNVLSTVAHEIRTPLTSILSFADILTKFPDESSETRQEFCSIIKKESERLTRLVNNMLDLSKIKAGKADWEFRKIHIGKTIRQAIDTMGPMAKEKGIELRCTVEEGLPTLLADEDRIQQVLQNLISNAIKFTPKEGRICFNTRRIEGRRTGEPKHVIHLSVSDSGIGIRPEELDSIFDRFRQCGLDTRQEAGGSGLGLAICKEIVASHRGNIWAESTYGKGTTIHITLPAWKAGTNVTRKTPMEL